MRSYKENNPCSTVGSIRVTDVATGASASSVDVCTIHVKEISEEAMDFLINEGEVMWCAGGLMVEHEKVRPFVTKIDGSEDGVMGMDKEVCARLLREVF
jgi:septum formation protein